jgi:hypothetical protein
MSGKVSARAKTSSSDTLAVSGILQRKCVCGTHTVAGGECASCQKEKGFGNLQRAANAGPVNQVPPLVHEVVRSPGQPLDAGTRSFMESRFNHDFSQVPVHRDPKAAESARAVNARAYTVGKHSHYRGQRVVEGGKNNKAGVADIQDSTNQFLDVPLPTFTNSSFNKDFSQTPTLRSFPHQEVIEQGLGIRIPGHSVVDTVECNRRGVQAFTNRQTTYFASAQPSLKVAAHEATHLAQHAGLSSEANLGGEGHAERVAGNIVNGTTARDLIGTNGQRLRPALRPYTEIPASAQSAAQWNAGMDLRVSEDGRMAVGQDTAMHSFWADPALISQSNSTLTSRKSVIRLHELADKLTGATSGGGGTRTLSKVSAENVSTATSGETMNLWADCGRSGRDVMGAGEGTGGGSMQAVFKEKPWYASIPILGPLLGGIFGSTIEKRTAASDPEEMKKEIFNKKLGGTGDEGLKKYQALPVVQKERFDKETGINRFAAPKVGEGYTMSSGGADYPGATTWNFHWAGVVMLSGADRVSLENYAVGDPSVKNSDWEFQMYGPGSRAGQTFYEQHKATKQHGDAPTAMNVDKG